MPRRSTGLRVTPEVVPLLGGNVDRWRLLVVGDRYRADEREVFYSYARRLAAHMSAMAPFDQAGIRGQFQVYACFSPTEDEGMFECSEKGERRYYGEPGLVRDYLDRHRRKRPVLKRRRNDLVLVLMNFLKRGGAGEQGNDNIAWSTPVHLFTADGRKQEDWCDVTLHELGHAFDLDDEYDQPPWPAGDRIPLRETNVWPHRDLANAPWTHLCVPNPPRRLSSREAASLNAGELAAYEGVGVGLFQGARYYTDRYWRSALRCKMRSTHDPFCKVCQNQIRSKIVGNA